MKILGIIPARFASTRFPGKPLADLRGVSMIERVYRQAKSASSLSKIVVATEHAGIYDHVTGFGGYACMTSENHPSGTDRCFEALTKEKESFDYVINIQGDEPFIEPGQIDLLASYLDGNTQLATLIKKIDTYEQLNSNSEVKVTFNTRNEALYFSRAVIPFIQKVDPGKWLDHFEFYKHVGMYAYRTDILKEITKLEIKVATTTVETMCVDTPEELEIAKQLLNRRR